MLAERKIPLPSELSPSETLELFLNIKEISLLDVTKAKSEALLPKVKEIIDTLDPLLRVSGWDFQFGKYEVLNIGEFVVKKFESEMNYRLVFINFLDYVSYQEDSIFLKVPGVRITYNSETKDVVRIDKMTCGDKGRKYTGFVPKK